MPVADGSHVSLLAVVAHPDDESLACGGLLAWCASLGAQVFVLCLTRGEGRLPVGPEGHDAADADRAAELQAAAAVLGVRDVWQLAYRDGYLPWEDAQAIEADVRAAVERWRPTIVVTFDRDGLYWHPDHVAVHERTTAVVEHLGATAPALFYVTMPPGRMRHVVEVVQGPAAGRGARAPAAGQVLGIDVEAFGAAAPTATLALEAGAFAARKLAALRRHRSQLAGDPLDNLPETEAATALGLELYRRARVGMQGRTLLDRLGRAL